MKNTPWLALALVTLAAPALADGPSSSANPPATLNGGKVVKLCDNKTTVQVPNDTPKTPAEGKKIADALMAQWESKHPDSKWVAEEVEAHQVVPPEDNTKLVGTGQSSTYGAVSAQDVKGVNGHISEAGATNMFTTVGTTAVQVVGIYAETGTASTTGGPWNVVIEYYLS